jgi:hypothetical protein
MKAKNSIIAGTRHRNGTNSGLDLYLCPATKECSQDIQTLA